MLKRKRYSDSDCCDKPSIFYSGEGQGTAELRQIVYGDDNWIKWVPKRILPLRLIRASLHPQNYYWLVWPQTNYQQYIFGLYTSDIEKYFFADVISGQFRLVEDTLPPSEFTRESKLFEWKISKRDAYPRLKHVQTGKFVFIERKNKKNNQPTNLEYRY